MPYHNFEDAAHVAKYIADINFSITGTAPVDSSPDKVKYYCSFTKHDITFDTTYQPPSAVDGEPTAADVLSLSSLTTPLPSSTTTTALTTSPTNTATRSRLRPSGPTRDTRRPSTG